MMCPPLAYDSKKMLFIFSMSGDGLEGYEIVECDKKRGILTKTKDCRSSTCSYFIGRYVYWGI